jgi:hypothetical protein
MHSAFPGKTSTGIRWRANTEAALPDTYSSHTYRQSRASNWTAATGQRRSSAAAFIAASV